MFLQRHFPAIAELLGSCLTLSGLDSFTPLRLPQCQELDELNLFVCHFRPTKVKFFTPLFAQYSQHDLRLACPAFRFVGRFRTADNRSRDGGSGARVGNRHRLTGGRLTHEDRICYSRNYLNMCGGCLPSPFLKQHGKGATGEEGSSASAQKGRGGHQSPISSNSLLRFKHNLLVLVFL